MVKLLVINPVGHPTWDEQDRKLYESFAPPGSEIKVVSLPKGPPSVETPRAHSQVVPLVIEKAKDMSQDFEAVAVNCFLDPGVDRLKKILSKAVVGPCEASLAIASVIGSRIGVITVHGKALKMVQDRVRKSDRKRNVASVIGVPLGVLDLNEDLERTRENIVEAAKKLKDKHHVDVICLGCTGLGGLGRDAQQAVKIPVIDPVGATVQAVLAAVSLKAFDFSPSELRSAQTGVD